MAKKFLVWFVYEINSFKNFSGFNHFLLKRYSFTSFQPALLLFMGERCYRRIPCMSVFGSATAVSYLAINKVFSVGQIFNSVIKFAVSLYKKNYADNKIPQALLVSCLHQ